MATTDEAKYYADIARGTLDKAMQSDQFWWASRRPMWDMNLINQGLIQQDEVVFNAYKALKLSGLSDDEKTQWYYPVIAARDIRSKIIEQLLMY